MVLEETLLAKLKNSLNAFATDTVLKIDTSGTTIIPGHNLDNPSKNVNFSSSSS